MSKFTDVLGREQFTMRDFKEIVDYLIDKDPLNSFVKLSDMVEEDINSSIDKLKKSYSRLDALVEEYRKTTDNVFNKLEEDYDKRQVQLEKMADNIKTLSNFECPNMYRYEQLLKLCADYSNLSNEAKDMFSAIIKKG